MEAKAKPFVCTTCTRCFVRQEHLKRHMRSHTQEKPFVCVFCGRCFARKDLVLRHQYKLHASLINNDEDIQSANNNTNTNNNNTKILKIAGNKATIVPTPSNPMAMTVAQLRKQQRKRHASFSASSESTYKNALPRKENLTSQAKSTTPPHQVGFATPQVNAVLPLDDFLNIDNFLLDNNNPASSGTTTTTTTATNNNISNFPASNYLTIGSTGQGGYSNAKISENSLHDFDHDVSPLDDKWLSNFLSDQILTDTKTQNDPNALWRLDHLNDIGFVISPSNSLSPENVMSSAIPSNNTSNTNSVSPSPTNSLTIQNNKHEINSKLPFGPSVSNLFLSRQMDLFNEFMTTTSLNTQTSPIFKSESSSFCFSTELRDHIINENKLKPDFFPTVEQLNSYLVNFKKNAHPFFPFIHLQSLVPSSENYPIILAIAAIGSLYSFHSSHAKLFSTIIWNKVKLLLETHKVDYSLTPLWIVQTMVLLSFMNIFSDDIRSIGTIKSQLMTLIQLIKYTKLNLPLELLENPPIESDHILDYEDNPLLLNSLIANYNSEAQREKNFRYFIRAQERIRTCHTVLILSNVFTAIMGTECSLQSIELKCGVPCQDEELFLFANSTDWNAKLLENGIKLDSKFSLIQLSNGGETYENCLMYMTSMGDHISHVTKNHISFRTILSMLISVHEKIFIERQKVRNKHYPTEVEDQFQYEDYNYKWDFFSRPVIESTIHSWETLYMNKGGILFPTAENIGKLQEHPELKLIIPLYHVVGIHKNVDTSEVMTKIWMKDWTGMNTAVGEISRDWNSLREANTYAISTVKHWIDTVSVMNNAKSTSINTPLFTIVCIFASVLVMSEYLRRIENGQGDNAMTIGSTLNEIDKKLWLQSEKLLKKLEMHLLPSGYNMQSYSEFLRVQAKGALDVAPLDDSVAEMSVDPSTPSNVMMDVIKTARLSTRTLYLGVRILGDAPIWPIALSFAHALQARAIHNNSYSIERQSKPLFAL